MSAGRRPEIVLTGTGLVCAAGSDCEAAWSTTGLALGASGRTHARIGMINQSIDVFNGPTYGTAPLPSRL